MDETEIDYADEEDYEYYETPDQVMGGQMWEQMFFQNLDTDLDLSVNPGETITDPEDRFKVDMRQYMNNLFDDSNKIRVEFREQNISLDGHYFPTDEDKVVLVQSLKKISFLKFKNPLLYVLGYIQAKQDKPLSKLWFQEENISPINIYMYARYWRFILF